MKLTPLAELLLLSALSPKIHLQVPRTTQYLGMVRRVVAMAAERVGFNAEEGASFPDNTPAFVEALNRSLACSTRGRVVVLCPTLTLT